MPNLFSAQKLDPNYIQRIFVQSGHFNSLAVKSLSAKAGTDIQIKYDRNIVYVKLVDSVSNDSLTILTLKEFYIRKKLFYEIKLSKSIEPGKGYLKYLLLVLVIDYNFKIICDDLHTIPGSMTFWKKLKNIPLTKCSVFNVDTLYKRKYILQPDYQIWGISDDFFSGGDLIASSIHDLRRRRIINLDFYNYVIDNEDYIKPRNNIRLILEKE